MSSNFDLDFNNNVENFEVEFGEVTRLTENDFNQLENRPSYNGNVMTGETNIPAVPTRTSDLQNDSDYQTGSEVQTAINTAIAGKQDVLTPGTGINISNDTISIDSTVVATQQNLANEVTNRENADNALQGQIDAISASSDVVDIVGTYAELQNYDTSALGDNDIIKVLQDETQNNATTYYRWSTTTQTFTLIGQEGPYYTKASADAQFVPQTRTVNGKALSANITLDASDVSALSPSDVDTQLANSTNPVQNKVLYGLLGNMPSDFFSGEASDTQTGTDITLGEAIGLTDLKMFGDTEQASYTGKNLFNKDAAPQGGYLANYSALSTGVRATAASAINYTYIRYVMNVENYVGQTLTLSATASASASNLPALAIGTCDSAGNNRVPKATQTGTGELTVSYTIASGDQYIYLNFYANQVGTAQVGDYADYENAQLELNASPTSYEPYTGGVSAPNPDFPQEIHTVTGEQIVRTTGKNICSETKVENATKNLFFRLPKLSSGEIVLSCTPGTVLVGATYGLLIDGTFIQLGTWSTNSRGKLIKSISLTAEQISEINAGTDVWIRTYKSAGGFVVPDDAMIEYGTLATSYEPYQSATYTINLGTTELCKIGDYQDYIYKSGDDWYVHKETGKVIYDGSENWLYQSTSVYPFRIDVSGAGAFSISDDTPPKLFTNYYTPVAWNDSQRPNYCVSITKNSIRLCFRNTDITSLASWKTWLGSNNTTIYYAIATPTDTKITDQTLIDGLNSALNMTCYDGETNVVVTSTNLAGALELVAVNANAKGLIYKARKGA